MISDKGTSSKGEPFRALYLDSQNITKLKPCSDVVASYLLALKAESQGKKPPMESDGNLFLKEIRHSWLEEEYVVSQRENLPLESGIFMLNNIECFLDNPAQFVKECKTVNGFGRKGGLNVTKKREEIYKFLL